MGRDVDNMTPDELRAEIRRLKEDLEDLEQTFNFNLANTPAHHPAGLVEGHEFELEEYRERIAKLEAMLKG